MTRRPIKNLATLGQASVCSIGHEKRDPPSTSCFQIRCGEKINVLHLEGTETLSFPYDLSPGEQDVSKEEFGRTAGSMMFTAGRNQTGLTEKQIEYCVEAWAVLCADMPIELDTSKAVQHSSRTRFIEEQNKVFLSADSLPGTGVDANSRMSTLGCLAHELAHAERFQLGYRRPTAMPDVLLDEAETNLRASFTSVLSLKDREDLVEDARDRLIQWLAIHQKGGQ